MSNQRPPRKWQSRKTNPHYKRTHQSRKDDNNRKGERRFKSPSNRPTHRRDNQWEQPIRKRVWTKTKHHKENINRKTKTLFRERQRTTTLTRRLPKRHRLHNPDEEQDKKHKAGKPFQTEKGTHRE